MKFSIVIITFNSAKTLERTLSQIKDSSDDILIIDSFSTDETENICKKYNTKFIKHEFIGYGQQKNFAIDNAKYDWILTIDSDEILSPKLKETIKNITLIDTNIYQCCRRNVFSYENKSFFYENTNYQTILFNRKKTRFKELPVHETLDLKDCQIVKIDGYLNHYTMFSRIEHIRKIIKYAQLSSKKKSNQNKKKSFSIKARFKASYAFIRTFIFKKSFLYTKAGFFVAKCSYINRLLKYS